MSSRHWRLIRTARTEIVKQMQQMVYDANAYIITEYYDYLQA